jgi:hypothetical protein
MTSAPLLSNLGPKKDWKVKQDETRTVWEKRNGLKPTPSRSGMWLISSALVHLAVVIGCSSVRTDGACRCWTPVRRRRRPSTPSSVYLILLSTGGNSSTSWILQVTNYYLYWTDDTHKEPSLFILCLREEARNDLVWNSDSLYEVKPKKRNLYVRGINLPQARPSTINLFF